jgi:protein tyrosine phosphatase (PTP) superfamily phosphohydrolase (DUF442 family)
MAPRKTFGRILHTLRLSGIILGSLLLCVASGWESEVLGAQVDLQPPNGKLQTITVANPRPPEWARKTDRAGLPNFYQVSTNLYRGAQPKAGGLTQLKQLGIKTVINLRSGSSDTDKIRDSGLNNERLPMRAWRSDEDDVVRFLKIVSNENNLPVFVHCKRGADRTGLMCAMYRIVICGWTKAEAIREMTQGGFGFSPVWKNIPLYIDHADVGRLKELAGIRESRGKTEVGSQTSGE